MIVQPSLSLIIRVLCDASGLAESDLRTASETKGAALYRDLGRYLASRLGTFSPGEICRTFGPLTPAGVADSIATVVAARAGNPEFRAFLEDLVLEIEVEAVARHRLGLGLPLDADPVAVARDVMAGRRSPASLSNLETLALAGAVAAHAAAQPEESAHVPL